jgi:ABC-type Mn2+/Zn2+ transport system ATPase subunit
MRFPGGGAEATSAPGRPQHTVAAGLSKRYGKRRPWVLDHIDLDLQPGTLTVVVGTNGSGKSTLLRVLAGVTRPTAGAVSRRPAHVGYAPERLPSAVAMTVGGYLGHMARLHGVEPASASRRIQALAVNLGIRPGLEEPLATLSKGNRQKVVLAQALLASFGGLLLLDEPSNGLDAAATDALQRELASAQRLGATILATAHHAGTIPGPDLTLVLSGGRLAPASNDPSLTVLVELLSHCGGALDAPPTWAAGLDAVAADGLWRIGVPATRVDRLLAQALQEGWSVHRVAPPTPPAPPALPAPPAPLRLSALPTPPKPQAPAGPDSRSGSGS